MTDIVPVPSVVLASEFPTLADRVAGEFNQKAWEWASSENAMSVRNREIALTAYTNATVAQEQAGIATAKANEAAISAQLVHDDALQTAADREQTGLDRAATAADRAQTALDRAATAADRLATAADRQAVEEALESIAGGPVASVNGKTGVVTGLVEAEQAVFEGSITEAVYALSGAAPALDPENGTIQTWTLTEASAPTDSIASGQAIVLHVDGAGFGITWPSVTWKTDGGNAPELASGVVVPIVLWKVGATLYGARVGDA